MMTELPQLNRSAFASCLARRGGGGGPEPAPDLQSLRRHYNFSLTDGLLVYLSIYPSKRIDGWFNDSVQQPAFNKWSAAFDGSTALASTR